MQLLPQPAGYYARGKIEFQGQDLLQLPEAEKRKLRGSAMAMIFQEPMTSLNPVLTIGFQLLEPLYHHTSAANRHTQSDCPAGAGPHSRSRASLSRISSSAFWWDETAGDDRDCDGL